MKTGSTPEMNAAKAFANPPPAIVRKAKRSLHDLEYIIDHAIDQAGLQMDIVEDAIFEAYETQAWREGEDTSLAAWAQRKWGKGKTWVYGIISDKVKQISSQANKVVSTITDSQQVKPSSRLIDNEEKDEEDEKPAVRAATPEQMKRVEPQGPRSEIGPTGKPSENGKPKHSLAIWKELSETHFGRALNRIDELNRQCPNPKLHAALIEAGKKCLAILEQWRQEVG